MLDDNVFVLESVWQVFHLFEQTDRITLCTDLWFSDESYIWVRLLVCLEPRLFLSFCQAEGLRDKVETRWVKLCAKFHCAREDVLVSKQLDIGVTIAHFLIA